MGIIEGIAALFGGGLTGLVGAGLQKFFDYKAKKLEIEAAKEKYAHEVKMKEADAAILAQEWAARTKVAEIEANAVIEKADAEAFSESFKTEPKFYSEKITPTKNQGWLFVTLDFFRGIIRPGLTVYLCVITTIIYLKASNLLNEGSILPVMAYDLAKAIIDTILYLTTTCVLWWFGTRSSKK